MDGQACHVLSIDQDLPAISADQANDHVKRGGLACPVGTQQTHHFTFVHLHRDVVHHFAAAVRLFQVVRFQPTGDQRLSHGFLLSRGLGSILKAGATGTGAALGAVVVFRGVSTARTR